MIHELLGTGKKTARTGRELASMLDTDIRQITRQIERERREGHPICASTDEENPGYYLAGTEKELREYCDRLKKRAIELFKTRQSLVRTLQAVYEKKKREDIKS